MTNKIDIFEILENNESSNSTKYITYSFNYKVRHKSNILIYFFGFFKYIFTSSFIFLLLLVTTNYKAYVELVNSYLQPEKVKLESTNIINSVEAAKISTVIKQKKKIKKKIEILKSKKAQYSIRKIALNTHKKDIKLNIEITPYENRLIIPKIAKNVPVVEVKNRTAKNARELENIFMEELEDGVVRYPGSAKPGKHGNTFIFGHSSNYPWIKGDYNEVFAKLGKLNKGDEIIMFYGQKKYTYIVKEKRVIKPGETKILKRNINKQELTLMTCWPVGTTLNRLIVISELKK